MTSIVELQNVSKVFGGAIGSKNANVALDDMTFAIEENSPTSSPLRAKAAAVRRP